MLLIQSFFLMLAAKVLTGQLCNGTQPPCIQNCRPTPKGPECQCREGFRLGKDGKTCEDVDECLIEGFCSQRCTNRVGGYECSCMEGYQQLNNTCQASGPEPILLFCTIQEIRAMFLRTRGYFFFHSAVTRASSVVLDPLESKVYWVEQSNTSMVYSSKLDGTDFQTVSINGLMVPEGMDVDYVARILYFTDSGLKQILNCKMDGSICHVLHSTTIDRPRAIAVDPPEGLLYWSDWGEATAGIYRSALDGRRRIAMVSKDIKWPNGIAIDHASNRLYWSDAKILTIEYITLDGKTRKVLIKNELYHPYSLAVFEDSLYWSDWHTFTLQSSNKFTGHKTTVMALENGKPIMGVHVYHPVLARRAQQKCPNNNLTCSNGRCILLSSKCDGTDDCGDNSDEIGCPCEDYTCPVSGECISWSRVCDGEHNCADLLDEGALCVTPCGGGNGSCAHQCQRTPQGPKCFCHEGFVLAEDGFSCHDECDTLGQCSHFCNRTRDGFKCSCVQGYVLEPDQGTCKAAGGGAHLAYLLKDGVRGFSLETHSRRLYFSKNFSSVIGISYDAADGAFYWADRKQKTINSYTNDSGQFDVLLATQQEPLLVRRDWMTKNIYYTTGEGSIVCCEGNGSYCSSVIANVSAHNSAFDVSPAFGFLFWSVSRHQDHNSVSGVIERANMDGSLREVIVSDRIFLPTAIAVDPVLEAIYWCDSMLGGIESADFNGFGRRKVVDHLQYPISITVFEDSIYWAERSTNSLSRCDKFSGKDCQTLLEETTPVNSLLIVHKAAQIQGENRCANNNCPHICLPTRTTFVCKCDDRNLTDTENCERRSSYLNLSCPEHYCLQNASCVIDGDHFVCKCPPHSVGERCETIQKHSASSTNAPHPVWIVCAVLVVICLCLLATSMLIYRRYRKSIEIFIGSKVQFVNNASFQGSCEEVEKVESHGNENEAVVLI